MKCRCYPKKDFEQVELVCREVKGNSRVFGGMQLIVCGDFYQLPPVANPAYHDSGSFCFESEIWKQTFHHHINFECVIRQCESIFIQAVRETAVGSVSIESDLFFKTLNRDLPENSKPTHLFSRNVDAAIFNQRQLDLLTGTETTYTATINTGRHKYLDKILAPYHLTLKLNCPVMLLRNLGGKLVNGLCGHVKELNDKYITVYVDKINETHQIEKYNFTVYDSLHKNTIAQRVQFPLQLAYGLTIHKSQGMTLDSVVVHCDGIFLPGQLSVAIGRAKHSTGVKLIHYRKGLCQQHKPEVNQFYGVKCAEFKENLEECCRNREFLEGRTKTHWLQINRICLKKNDFSKRF